MVASVVLGVMVVMAATGLTYALMTVSVRREHDRALPPKMRKPFEIFRKKEPQPGELTEPTEAVAPIRLAGLGYLTPGTNVVAGVHVEELLAWSAGKGFRGRGVKVGNIELKLEDVKDWLGLAVEEIDHVVLGVEMGDGKEFVLTPPVCVVARTRQPYDMDLVKKALKATQPRQQSAPGGSKRLVYSAKMQSLPVDMALWLADERTIILGLFSNLEDVPLVPHLGVSQLPAELRQVLQQRLGAGVPVWLAGHSANWEQTVLPMLLSGWKALPVLSRIRDVRTFAIALQPEKPAKVLASFRCADEASAKRIEQQELARRAKADSEGFRFSRESQWLNVQMTVNIGGSTSRPGK
jgi:hypothetical protein